MSNYIKFDTSDIQTIIASLDEIPDDSRTEQEETVLQKARQIAGLQAAANESVRPELLIDESNGRLTISRGKELSEPVSYKGIAKLGNVFAVTDFYKDIFPTNVLLKFFHANQADRAEFEKIRKQNLILKGEALEAALKR